MNVTIDVVNNSESFETILTKRTRLIVLIYASWCPFCQTFIPVFQRYAEGNPQLFLMLQDDEEKMAPQYAVNIYPSILFFENGAISKRLDGVPGKGLQEEQFAIFIDQWGAVRYGWKSKSLNARRGSCWGKITGIGMRTRPLQKLRLRKNRFYCIFAMTPVSHVKR